MVVLEITYGHSIRNGSLLLPETKHNSSNCKYIVRNPKATEALIYRWGKGKKESDENLRKSEILRCNLFALCPIGRKARQDHAICLISNKTSWSMLCFNFTWHASCRTTDDYLIMYKIYVNLSWK